MLRYGDLQLIPLDNKYMIIACDSAGSIGNKPNDAVRIEPEEAGYFTARVPLMEVLATKGEIISVVDTLSVEMDPTGARIIKGIKKGLIEVGIDPNTLTGSTEENMPTQSTAIGVTVIGQINKHKLETKRISKGMKVLVAGFPKVGDEFVREELIEHKGETLNLNWMKKFSADDMIEDMIPVGSSGINHEIKVMSKRHNCHIHLINEDKIHISIDLNKSAGPATCLLMITGHENMEKIIQKYKGIPITLIGEIIK